MSKKLMLLGGLSVASVATIAPAGLHFKKEADQKRKGEEKIEQARKERQNFISRTDAAVNELNEDSETRNEHGLLFLKDSGDEDKGKLMGIGDVYKGYREHKKDQSYVGQHTKEEMQEAEKLYGEDQVTKQQGKGAKGMTEQGLDQANSKSQHGEKFKEMCLILILNKKIDKNENMNSSDVDKFLCVGAEDTFKDSLTKYEGYKNTDSSLDMREHLGTVQVKSSNSQATGK